MEPPDDELWEVYQCAFEEAWTALKEGYPICRSFWGDQAWLVAKDDGLVYKVDTKGWESVWEPRLYDILADDWEIYDGSTEPAES